LVRLSSHVSVLPTPLVVSCVEGAAHRSLKHPPMPEATVLPVKPLLLPLPLRLLEPLQLPRLVLGCFLSDVELTESWVVCCALPCFCVLCCAGLRCAALCCAALCCAVLRCAVLRCAVLC
jgi:hypothetical protein